MEQALKVIKFNPDDNNSLKGLKNKSSKLRFSSELLPMVIAATFAAILGVVSLVLEVKIYFQFRYEIYLARLFPTIFSLITLILLQTNFGRKNYKLISHFFLFSVLASLSFVVYKIPTLYNYNITAAALFVLTLSIFLRWERINQAILSGYFLLLFGMSAIFGDLIFTENSSFILVIITTISVQIIGFVISGKVNNSETKKVQFKETVTVENENEDNFRSFFEKSLIPFFQMELNGRIKFANSSLRELLGLNNEEEQNEINFFNDVINNDKIKTHLIKKLESKGRVENYRFKFVRGDKTEEVFILDCQTKKNGDTVYVDGSVKNITQQYLSNKALQKEIEELQQSKRQNIKIIPSFNEPITKKANIISKMGHELRTPMNSVLGFLTLIENGLFENEDELKEFSHSAKLSAESLLSLINDVVEISKIQDGTVDIVNTEFDLKNEIEVVSSNLKPQMDLKNISFNVNISDEIPEKIITDPTKYSQIVTNLVRNAINNTEEGEIELLIFKSKNQKGNASIITKVIDNSEGLDDEELLKLISYSTDKKNEGSKVTAGILHIMIARELTTLLGGEFKAKSELGSGTEFSFEIEMEKIELQKEDNISNVKVINNVSSRPTLLLVEDNPISRKVEQKLLQEAGYEVHCVETGEDAIENVRSGKYNLVLMDIELKDMNGLEATKKIRELDDKINGIPIIAVTAHSSMKDREKCLIAGMNDYISKPINITFLKMTIDQWLKTAKSMSN